jgi:hypothetical protein
VATTCTEDGYKQTTKTSTTIGRRNIGRLRKRWRDQLHLEDQGTGNTPNPSWTWWWWWYTAFGSSVTVYNFTLLNFPFIKQHLYWPKFLQAYKLCPDGKPSRHNSKFVRCIGVICENCTQHCPCTTGIQHCVCAWWVPKYVMEVHENWCLEVLFHFLSHLKEEQMGSLNPWWHCETLFRHFTQNEL